MILLDTHAWIWFVSQPSALSKRARAAIDYAREIGVSTISCWEISTKVSLGKLVLDREPWAWIQQALSQPRVRPVEVTATIATAAGLLSREDFHGDPADRILVASAIELGIPLVTKDHAIRDFAAVRTVW